MGRVRPYLAVGLGVLLQVLVLDRLRFWNVHPLILPSLVFFLALHEGADRGAAAGLLTGGALFLLGGSPWSLALYALLGGVSGAVFQTDAGFWGIWLRFLPVAAAMDAALVIRHWPARAALRAALDIAGPELFLMVLFFPLAVLCVGLMGRARPRQPVL